MYSLSTFVPSSLYLSRRGNCYLYDLVFFFFTPLVACMNISAGWWVELTVGSGTPDCVSAAACCPGGFWLPPSLPSYWVSLSICHSVIWLFLFYFFLNIVVLIKECAKNKRDDCLHYYIQSLTKWVKIKSVKVCCWWYLELTFYSICVSQLAFLKKGLGKQPTFF